MAYDFQTQWDSPNFTAEKDARAVFGQPRIIKGITLHWWGDPNTNPTYEGVVDYLCRPNGNSSAHLVVTGTGRRAACIVNFNDVAWHSGNATGNATTIGIELDPRCRDEDYDVAAEVVADIRAAYGDIPIYSHNMWMSTRCPGNYDINRVDQLSYTKYSHPTDWGKGGDKVQPSPLPVPVPEPPTPPAPEPPIPTPTPEPTPAPEPSKPSLIDKVIAAIEFLWNVLKKLIARK